MRWLAKLEGKALMAGQFDFEIILLRRGMATIPIERLDSIHPQARAELVAMFEAEAMYAKIQEAKRK